VAREIGYLSAIIVVLFVADGQYTALAVMAGLLIQAVFQAATV